jgi:hypothetical protein
LGSIPLSSKLRAAGDDGVPLVTTTHQDVARDVLVKIAQTIITSGATLVGRKLPLSKR